MFLRKQSYYYYIIALTILIFTSFAGAINRKMQFRHLTTNEGLSHRYVRCMIQDNQGFMWFGTFDGLNRYDGYHFKVYRYQDNDSTSIPSNIIFSLYKDRAENLWIGTIDGLCRYDPGKDAFIRYLKEYRHSVQSIYEDSHGNICVGTAEAGLFLLNPNSRHYKQYAHQENDPTSIGSNEIRSIFEDDRQRLWIGTIGSGVNCFDPGTETFIQYRHDENDPGSIAGNNVYDIIEDPEGRIWLACHRQGISVMNVNQNKPEFYNYLSESGNRNECNHQSARVLCLDKEGMWIGTQNWGLEYFDFRSKTFHSYQYKKYDPNSLGSNSVYSIFIDQVNDLWIGTYANGISVSHGSNQGFKTFQHIEKQSNSLSHNQVWEFCEDAEGMIWIATDGGGLNRFNPKNLTFQCYHSKNSNLNRDAVLSVYVDFQNNIWIGTWDGGFSRFDRLSKSFRAYNTQNSGLLNDNVMDITGDGRGNLWLATQNGLHCFNVLSESFHIYTPENSDLIFRQMEVVKMDCRGRVLIGNVNGFIIFDPKTESFTNYVHNTENPNSLSNNFIMSIFEEDSSKIWIATTNGLNRLNLKTDTITRFYQKDGLPNNLVFGVEKDDYGDLWISTNGGLSRYNPRLKEFQNYTKEDGLQGNMFQKKCHLKSGDGLLYFGGADGFNVFDPGEIDYNVNIPPVVFTEFKILNASSNNSDSQTFVTTQINHLEQIVLPYHLNAFYFEFAALNYIFSTKNKYTYCLHGFDKGWHEASEQRRATYTNISPGEYVFQVKGSNNDGVWNETGKSIHLLIRPPFWEKLWFRGTIGLLMIGLLAAAYQYRMIRINKYRRELETRVQERTALLEEANKELEAFSYSVSHDLRAPLRAMDGFSRALIDDYEQLLDSTAKDYLCRIRKASQRMGHLIDGLLKLSRLSRSEMHMHRVNLTDIVNALFTEYQNSDPDRSIEFKIQKSVYVTGDTALIRVMMRNLLDNAYKFTRERLNAKIEFGSMMIDGIRAGFIKDNGIGFDKRYSNQLFEVFQRQHPDYEGTGIGLATVKRIAHRHGWQIWADGEIDKGAVFYFTLPDNPPLNVRRTR